MDKVVVFTKLTDALPWPRPEGEEAEGDDVGGVLLEEPLRPELFRLRPEVRVMVDDVVGEPDERPSLDLDVSELSLSLPVLHTLPVISRNGREHPEVFLVIKRLVQNFCFSPAFTDLDTGIQVGHVGDGLVVDNTIELLSDLVHLLQQSIEDVRVPGQVVAQSGQSVGGRLKSGSEKNNSLEREKISFFSI